MSELSKTKSDFRIAVEKKIVGFLRKVVLPALAKIINFLESKGITRRRVKYWLILVVSITVIMTLFFVGGYAFLFLIIPFIATEFKLGVQTKLIELSLFVTLWVAEVPITIVTAIILRAVLRESQPIAPQLVIWDIYSYEEKNGSVMFAALIWNRGDTAAFACEATLRVSDVKPKDVLVLPKIRVRVKPQNFRPPLIVNNLRWEHDVRSKQPTIRSGREVEVPFLRVIPARKNVPLHFEIPSENGWEPIFAALRPDFYSLLLTVSPLNGKSSKKRLIVKWNTDTGASVDFGI